MKTIISIAFALVSVSTFAQSSNQQQLDPHLNAVLTLNADLVETEKHSDGFTSYKIYGYVLIQNFLDTMQENYPRITIVSETPKMFLFTDTTDKIGVATILETPYHAYDMLEIIYENN